MKIFAQKPIENIRILNGTPNDYSLRFSKINDALKNSGIENIFAEPRITGKDIAWISHSKAKIRAYKDLPAAEKQQADDLLRRQAGKIIMHLSENEELAASVKQYLTVPSSEDIYLLGESDKQSILLTQWGAVSDDADVQPLQITADEHFPVPVIFKLQYTNGEDAPKESVSVFFNQKENSETADEEALIDFGTLKTGNKISVYQYVDGNKVSVHDFVIDTRQNYIVQLAPPQDMNFKVQDSNGKAIPNMEFVFEYSDKEEKHTSNEDARITVKSVKPGTKLAAYNPKNGERMHEQNFVCQDGKEEYLIIIPAPKEKVPPPPEPEISPIRVKLIDHKNRPIPEKEITFTHKEDKSTHTTDNEGLCNLSLTDPQAEDKIKAEIRLKKRKIKKREISYNPEQDEYIIKLKKCRWCWLLLLLLLPLLLLIPLKKDVSFKVINSYTDKAVAGIPLNFEYTKRDMFNFDSLKFFTRYYPVPKPAYQDTTDSTGVAVFRSVKYSVYQWLFKKNDTARVYALSDCFNLDSTLNFFDLKGETVVYMHPILLDMDFTVVDKDDDNEPIIDAKVVIEADMFNYKDSAQSDENGRVQFKKIPLCSNVSVIGSRFGYRPDTIADKARNIYNEQDTLYLRQITKPVVFFVKDLKSKKGIPNATGTLYLKGTGKVTPSVKTNRNGKGKIFKGEGTFPDVHIIQHLKIHAAKAPYYKDSTTLDFDVPKFFPVNEWINSYTEEQQTIYLRPLERPILFQDIDEKTGRGISGVKNTVTITHADGSTEKLPAPVESDHAGNFGFSAVVGDKITIVAESDHCPPRYMKNDYTITDADFGMLEKDAAARKIPLKRADAPKLIFRNIDSKTGNPISGVTNKVYADGSFIGNYTSGGNGKFTVDKVYDCQKISITASKSGYGSNSKTIQNRPMEVLIPAAPSERDIPLVKDAPPPPPPPGTMKCEGKGSGGQGTTVTVHDLEGCNQFTIAWDMYQKPDKLSVYAGHGSSKTLIWSTGRPVSYTGIRYLTCKQKYITVIMQGAQEGTEWNYRLDCECD